MSLFDIGRRFALGCYVLNGVTGMSFSFPRRGGRARRKYYGANGEMFFSFFAARNLWNGTGYIVIAHFCWKCVVFGKSDYLCPVFSPGRGGSKY